jgi:hypothetical protein
MTDQGEFDFQSKPVTPPATEVDRLIRHLFEAGAAWITARELAASLDLTDRKIRQLAEHSDGLIISGPGCPGYRHLHHCTADQLREVADRLNSQARSMMRRSIRIRRRAHALIH